MQTVAPERLQQPHQLHLVPPSPRIRVANMRAGDQFFVPGHSTSVVAVLSHSQMNVKDLTRIWVVIVAAQTGSNDVVGSIFGVPHDAEVTPLDLIGAPRYAMVDF